MILYDFEDICDDLFYKTDKSDLFKSVEEDVQNKAPIYTEICLIDRFFLSHSFKYLPKSFGSDGDN